MAFSIDNFSNFFCYVFSVPLTIPHESNLARSQLSVEQKTLLEVTNNLYKVFWERFHPVVEKLMVYEKSNTHTFMENVLATCKAISGKNPTYERFILVCTFINRIIDDSFEYTDCFIVPKVCYCVLLSVYRSCYKNYFDSREEGDTLDSHIRALKKYLVTQKISEIRREIPVFGRIYDELKNLTDVEGIPLEDFEQRMLRQMNSIAPVEFCDGRISVSLSESSSEGASENEAMNEDASENEAMNEGTSENEAMNEDASENEPMLEDSLETTSKSLKTLSGEDIHTEDSSESEPSLPGRDSNKEDENKVVILERDYLCFKNRTCGLCDGKCANFMVSYVEKILGKC